MAETTVLLSASNLALVREILDRNGIEARHQTLLFGSRVSGRARRYSDLDIGFIGDRVPSAQLGQLREDLEESDLPIRVDVLNFADTNDAFRTHALAASVPLDQAVPTQ